MLLLAWPVLVEQMLSLLVGYTDWWLTGHYFRGDAFPAAMGLMSYVLWMLPNSFAAVAIGATALVSRQMGKGDPAKASHIMNQALLAGALFATGATLAIVFWGEAFIALMQLSDAAAPLAESYLRTLTPVVPFIMFNQVGAACLRGAGDTVTGFVAQLCVNVVNISLSTALVSGLGPFPDWGWGGLALGTACGHATGGLIVLLALLRGRAGLRVNFRLLRPDWEILRRLLRIGVPGGIDVAIILACHLAYVAIINSLGDAAAGAHGLGVHIESLAYMPGSAFQVAAATLTGQYLGAEKPRQAMQGILACTLAGGTLMTLAGCVFFFLGSYLTHFFTGDNDPAMALRTAGLLKIVAVSMPSLAVSMIVTGGLRGAGDTRWPLLFTLIGFLGVRIPGACWLAYDQITLWDGFVITGWNWSVEGAWWAMVCDVVLRSLLVTGRLWQGAWKDARV
ncbi:Multidrug resistance protein MdtK [Lignipirellula cremea]|uniref:Multidrug-efflux transporter n=2 Tax=Lignipirellula cremea TaxID=2528010 RepID=A0A518DY00_9BACT|nr:Multidrug resistance protein MdtK [Lignipirellula cremea]